MAAGGITAGSFLLTCVLLVNLVRVRVQLRKFVRVPGVVVDVRRRDTPSSSEGGTSTAVAYAPVLAFRTTDGRDVQTESPRWSNLHADKTGRRVAVVYDPDEPELAYIDSPSGTPTLVYVLGAGLTLLIFLISGAALLGRLS